MNKYNLQSSSVNRLEYNQYRSSNLVLTSNIPDSEADVFVLYSLHIKPCI